MVALPAVAELFKGSIDESLKRLVQPAAVVPASVFTLLNVAFLYPALVESGFGPAVALEGLDDVWKAVAITAFVLVLGYVILNLSGSIMRLATGESLVETSLGDWMKSRWQRRILDLADKVSEYSEYDATPLPLRAQDARLPPAPAAAPTRLGNYLTGANASVIARYGFDLSATWVHLSQIIATDEKELSAALDEERTGIQVLLNLAAVTAVFGFEGAALTVATHDATGTPWLLVAAPAAYLLYRSACARALSYGELVEATVDLHRGKLAKALGLDDTDDPLQEKAAWRDMTRWLTSDVLTVKPVDPVSVPAMSSVAPGTVKLTNLPSARAAALDLRSTTAGISAFSTEHYRTLVEPILTDECCDSPVATPILLSADKPWRWSGSPEVEIGGSLVPGTVVSGGTAGDSLLIRLTLAANQSTDLHVEYPREVVRLALLDPKTRTPHPRLQASFTTPPIMGHWQLDFAVVNHDAVEQPVRIVFACTWAKLAPLIRVGGIGVSPVRAEGTDTWFAAAEIPKGASSLVVLLPTRNPQRRSKPTSELRPHRH